MTTTVTTTVTTPAIRRATESDLPALLAADERGFSYSMGEHEAADSFTLMSPQDALLAVDGEQVVGMTAAYPWMTMTLPGGAALPAPGVAWVSVAATHRRRGLLRALFTEQHRDFLDAGVPLAMLTASESAIYGRFGYGEASRRRQVEIDRRFAVFRTDAPDPGGVRYATTAETAEHAPQVHRRWAARTPGAVSRNDAWWTRRGHDREYRRGGASKLFHLVHADGYVDYRASWGSDGNAELDVEVFAVTDEARAALWRVLLATDLVTTIRTAMPFDHPLPFWLTEPRIVRTTTVTDGLWVRVLDVPAVLAARRYAIEIDTVLDVRDGFLDRGGRFRLVGGPDGATCTPTTDAADVLLDVADLGSLVTGCHRAATLARAGRVRGTVDALHRIDIAFTTEREPVHGTSF